MTEANADSQRTRYGILKRILPWLVLFIFLCGVEYLFGWQQILRPWQSFSIWQVVGGVVLILLSYALRTLRLYDYFYPQMAGRWLTALRLMLLHNALNNLLPARTGEISFPVLMRRDFGVDYPASVSALLWFRLLDLHTILTIAIYPLGLAASWQPWVLPMMGLWLCLPLLVFGGRQHLERYGHRLDSRWRNLWQQSLHGLPKTPAQFWKSWGLTWVNWSVKLLTLAWVLGQFVANVPWNVLLGGVIGGELTSVLPFHAPGGVGTYEAGVLAALAAFVVVDTATMGAINTHLFVLGSSLLGGLIGWLLPYDRSGSHKHHGSGHVRGE